VGEALCAERVCLLRCVQAKVGLAVVLYNVKMRLRLRQQEHDAQCLIAVAVQ
jgi:hypothetical protein